MPTESGLIKLMIIGK